MELSKLYRTRFSDRDLEKKNKVWEIICKNYFQKFVKQSDKVLDLGAGYCEFINNINCSYKIAVDFNSDVCRYADKNVKIFLGNSTKLDFIDDDTIDVVFISNVLEHLESKAEIIQTLREVRRVLRPDGIVMILQPNIRFLHRAYWDFFDHNIPLSDRSLVEALSLVGLHCIKIIPKFLPYTTKSIGSAVKQAIKPLIIIYLYMPWLQRAFGKQLFIVAKK